MEIRQLHEGLGVVVIDCTLLKLHLLITCSRFVCLENQKSERGYTVDRYGLGIRNAWQKPATSLRLPPKS